MRITMILEVIDTLMSAGDYDKIDDLINDGQALCSCCNE